MYGLKRFSSLLVGMAWMSAGCTTASSATSAAATVHEAATSPAVSAPMQFVSVGSISYAYRSFGKKSEYPLVLFQHFRGSLDNWDPALLDALAAQRAVVVFDNKGVSSSAGETPSSFREMADDAAAFIAALNYQKVDILGFSIGGAVAQELLLNHGELVHRAILAATAPQGGEGLNTRQPKIVAIATKPIPVPEDFLTLFFEPTESSQAAGQAFLTRRLAHSVDKASSVQTMKAQGKARMYWGATQDPGFVRIKSIKHPVLVANGSHDIMMPTPNSVLLFRNLPNAQLILYPDSGHGFMFQYPELFAMHANIFLDTKD